MTRRLRLGAVLLAGTLVLATPALAAAPPKQVGTKINTANGSIGQLKLGISSSKARGLLGKPDNQNSKGYSGKSSSLTMTYARYGLNLTFWRGTQGGSVKLANISVTSPQYKANGVGIGSSVSQLQRSVKGVQCFSRSAAIRQPFCQLARKGGDITFNVAGSKVSSIRIGS